MNTLFTAYDRETGRVLFGGTSSEPMLFENETTGVLLGLMHESGYVLDGSVMDLPEKPSPHHTFDYTAKQWIDPRTLQDLKDAQWTQIKQARTQAEYGGFEWDGSRFDSDATSQNRITGAVQLAQIVPSFTIDWTLEDNTVRTLSAADMVAVGEALGVHVQTQFVKAQALRAQIDAATTKEAVEAVVW